MSQDDTQTIPQDLQQLCDWFLSIPVPYFIGKGSISLKRRVYKGKGRKEEIQKVLNELQEIYPEKDGYSLLKDNNIGIDCSGLVLDIYEQFTLSRLQKHAKSFFKRPTLNPFLLVLYAIKPDTAKLNADTLTSKINCQEIPVSQVKPMDLIRMSGGKHVVMITTIKKNGGKVAEIEYIQSSTGKGVCMGKITITDDTKSITDQDWNQIERLKYQPNELIRRRVNDNGIRRPLFLTNTHV